MANEQLQKHVISIVVTLGAFLIGMGMLSFIASNWESMSDPGKLAVIFVSMIGAYAAGWFLKEHKKMERTGTALILLGAIIYGAGIFLIGQIYNININWPEAFFFWMLGAIAIAWVTQAKSVFLLALATGFIGYFGLIETPFDSAINTSTSLGTLGLTLLVLLVSFFAGLIMNASRK